ncbi:MAG: hypothetical protein Q8R61_01750 [Thiobacillus sp.]|uniref:hypothetical protein n=1 Tax=Thiobacillus sp. TaxID=924 RepID=UPI00273584C8|nr:hypothetical protein [Thiobacillus sp.]MDP3583821.1 hypothetical protein [Thiobacillus sp.]
MLELALLSYVEIAALDHHIVSGGVFALPGLFVELFLGCLLEAFGLLLCSLPFALDSQFMLSGPLGLRPQVGLELGHGLLHRLADLMDHVFGVKNVADIDNGRDDKNANDRFEHGVHALVALPGVGIEIIHLSAFGFSSYQMQPLRYRSPCFSRPPGRPLFCSLPNLRTSGEVIHWQALKLAAISE